MTFTHAIDVRYGECDQQGVVFNANYLVYTDDAMDHWMRSLGGLSWDGGWDVMLKRAVVTWHAPARWPETVSIDCGVSRWGTTSFDVMFRLRVEDRSIGDVLVTYVSVPTGSTTPMATPAEARAALGPLVQIDPESAS